MGMRMEKKRKPVEERLDMLVNLVWRDPMLWRSVCAMGWYEEERVELLWRILQGVLQYRDRREVEEWIYQYGSMIKEQDLVARQIFIWLLNLAATLPRREQEGQE